MVWGKGEAVVVETGCLPPPAEAWRAKEGRGNAGGEVSAKESGAPLRSGVGCACESRFADVDGRLKEKVSASLLRQAIHRARRPSTSGEKPTLSMREEGRTLCLLTRVSSMYRTTAFVGLYEAHPVRSKTPRRLPSGHGGQSPHARPTGYRARPYPTHLLPERQQPLRAIPPISRCGVAQRTKCSGLLRH